VAAERRKLFGLSASLSGDIFHAVILRRRSAPKDLAFSRGV
jgi:hypothetical protein